MVLKDFAVAGALKSRDQISIDFKRRGSRQRLVD